MFLTECIDYFLWQSLGMVYSFAKTGMHGPLTRILCCTDEDYKRLD